MLLEDSTSEIYSQTCSQLEPVGLENDELCTVLNAFTSGKK